MPCHQSRFVVVRTGLVSVSRTRARPNAPDVRAASRIGAAAVFATRLPTSMPTSRRNLAAESSSCSGARPRRPVARKKTSANNSGRASQLTRSTSIAAFAGAWRIAAARSRALPDPEPIRTVKTPAESLRTCNALSNATTGRPSMTASVTTDGPSSRRLGTSTTRDRNINRQRSSCGSQCRIVTRSDTPKLRATRAIRRLSEPPPTMVRCHPGKCYNARKASTWPFQGLSRPATINVRDASVSDSSIVYSLVAYSLRTGMSSGVATLCMRSTARLRKSGGSRSRDSRGSPQAQCQRPTKHHPGS